VRRLIRPTSVEKGARSTFSVKDKDALEEVAAKMCSLGSQELRSKGGWKRSRAMASPQRIGSISACSLAITTRCR